MLSWFIKQSLVWYYDIDIGHLLRADLTTVVGGLTKHSDEPLSSLS